LKNSLRQGFPKYLIGFLVCIGIRLLPFRPPNVEPIMTTTMPFARKWGWYAGALFGALSIMIYDSINPAKGFARVGVWTVVTALMYGLIGAAAGFYLLNKPGKIRYYVGFAFLATLLYDFVTGPIMSSLFFKMPFMVALIGQIPFTLLHLAGNLAGAAVVSPLLYKWIVSNPHLDTNAVIARLRNVKPA
jgi:hypothetical protein